jgi:hypothetical protein
MYSAWETGAFYAGGATGRMWREKNDMPEEWTYTRWKTVPSGKSCGMHRDGEFSKVVIRIWAEGVVARADHVFDGNRVLQQQSIPSSIFFESVPFYQTES